MMEECQQIGRGERVASPNIPNRVVVTRCLIVSIYLLSSSPRAIASCLEE